MNCCIEFKHHLFLWLFFYHAKQCQPASHEKVHNILKSDYALKLICYQVHGKNIRVYTVSNVLVYLFSHKCDISYNRRRMCVKMSLGILMFFSLFPTVSPFSWYKTLLILYNRMQTNLWYFHYKYTKSCLGRP